METSLEERFALACFVFECNYPDLFQCNVYRKLNKSNRKILVIDAPTIPIAKALWFKRCRLSQVAIKLKVAHVIKILIEGQLFRLPFEVHSTLNSTMTLNLKGATDGQIAARLLDSGLSGAIVDLETNRLLEATNEIVRTAGRDPFYMKTCGQDLNSMWRPDVLEELNRDLRQASEATLSDRQYRAYTWVQQEEGIWTRSERQFKAKELRLIEFQGRVCRLSLGVEIIN